MALTYKFDILLGCERHAELVVQHCDKIFTSWQQCQFECLGRITNLSFPDHFGHPYIRYTSYRAEIKIKSIIFLPLLIVVENIMAKTCAICNGGNRN